MIMLSDQNLLRTGAFIGGQWIDAFSGETFEVQNPADQTDIAEVAKCGKEETRRAINEANEAFKLWRLRTAKERSKILENWADLLVSHKKDLAEILTAEQGKPLDEAEGEVLYGAGYVKWFAEEAKRIYGDTLPSNSQNDRVICIKQPVGVVACITPWNFPNAMLARKIAPALAAGCTVVCKPANNTPLSAMAMVELANRAGVPKGVINLLSGKTAEIGDELTANSVVRKLTFTGSTPVGKKLMADCARTMKRTSMELGGNAPFIVFEDADLDEAIYGLMLSKFRNAGQTCVCTNRVLVQASVLDEFVEKLAEKVACLSIGNGAHKSVDVGPLIDEKAALNVREIIQEAVNKGAQIIAGGAECDIGKNYVKPTVLGNVKTSMRVLREEIFGPVVPILGFETEAEAIELANDTPFGLAAYFYSRDIGRIWRVGENLECGMVGINTAAISNEMSPFGGVKESGQGREGSKYGLDDYLEIKSLCMGGLNQ